MTPTSEDGPFLDESEPVVDGAEAWFAACLGGSRDPSALLAEGTGVDAAAVARAAHWIELLDEVGFLHGPEANDELPARIGDYQVRALLGSGGMGVVYLAEHAELGRRVALKVLHRDLAADPRAEARFRREALVASRLDHPAICTLYEIGRDGPQSFLALRYVTGLSLQQHLAAGRATGHALVELPRPAGQSAQEAVLRFCETVARALHAAHEAGLVHRDVKPGNLMVTPDGEPVLLDFGLALADGDETLTIAGDRLGTPVYMSPEQVLGHRADRRTDVYALGVVLYECLTGSPPFRDVRRESLFRSILKGEIPEPSRRQGAIGRDLRTVLLTALAADASRRYATANDLAEDLRRVRVRMPILARRPGPVLRGRRFVQRNPIVSVALALLVGAVAVLARTLRQLDVSLGTRQAVELALRATAGRSDLAEALGMALAAYERAPGVDTRSALSSALDSCRERVRIELDDLPSSTIPTSLDLDAGGERFLTIGYGGAARMLNRSGELLAVLPHARLVNGAVFEPDGDRVATASMDGTAAVWSDSGERLHVLDHGPAGHDAEIGWIDPESSGAVFWASWSPDGGRFATGCADRRLRFWDADDGQLRGPPIDGHQGPPLAFAWSSDGALLATAEGDAELDLGLGPALVLVHRSDPPFARIARLELPAAVFGLAFHPDGHLLATACADGRVRVHSLPDGEPVVTHDLGGKAVEVSWSRRGDRLLASSTGGAAAIWRPDGALLRRRLFEAGVWLRFAGDDHIFGHGPGRAVLLLDDELRERFVGQGHSQRVCGVALAGDASCIVSVAEDRTARVWQVQDPELPSAHAHDSRIAALSPSPDAGVVSVGEDGTVAVCDAGGRPLRRLPIARRAIVGAVLDPVGGRLAVVGYDSRVDALDLVTGRPLGEFVPPGLRGRGGGAAWLGSDRLAVGGAGPLDIHVYEVPRGRSETWSKSTGGMIRAMASAPRRQLLFAAGWNGRIACWGWDGTLRAEPPTGQATWFDTLAVSPDEKWLAAGGGDRRVYVFRVGPGEEVLVPLPGSPFLAHDASVQALAFSPDGRWFATAAEDGSVHLWSMATWTVTTRLRAGDRRGLRSGEVGLAFSADSTRLWTAGGGGAIRTFACDPDELVRLAHERLAQIRGGCPPIRRYLDLHDRDDTASAFAVAERIIATASRVGDRRTLHAFAARLIGLEDGGPVELNLARRAVDQALDGLADPPPRWLGTLARWHAARGDYPAAVEVQRRAVALRPLPELLAALADYERRAVAGR